MSVGLAKRYRIQGVNRANGEAMELVLEATNERDACKRASSCGMLVSSCRSEGASAEEKKAIPPATHFKMAGGVLIVVILGGAFLCSWLFWGNSGPRMWNRFQSGDPRSALVHELDQWIGQKDSQAMPLVAALNKTVLISYDIKSFEEVPDPLGGTEFRAVVNLTHSNKLGGNPVNQVVYLIRRRSEESQWQVQVDPQSDANGFYH